MRSLKFGIALLAISIATAAKAQTYPNPTVANITDRGVTAGKLLLSGGTAGPITGSLVGTGILNALGVDIGVAGAPVLFNGAGGTPSSIDLTNATNVPAGALTGTVAAGRLPALTGDATSSAGSAATTVTKTNGVSFGALATLSPGANVATVLGNAANANGGLLTSNAPVFTGNVKVNTRVVSASTDSPSATADYLLCVSYTSTGAVTITLPAGATGLTYLIKDCGGNAATNVITINPAAGNVDGASSYVIGTNYGSAALTYVNGQWSSN